MKNRKNKKITTLYKIRPAKDFLLTWKKHLIIIFLVIERRVKMLELKNISFTRDNKKILDNIKILQVKPTNT